MQLFCPNKNNKNIKAEFEELVDALGEDLAYLLWHRSEGEGLGNHPGLADSEQFLNVLLSNDGNRVEAIRLVAKILLSNLRTASTLSINESIHYVAEFIDGERKKYVDNVVANYNRNNSDASAENITDVENKARIQFDRLKVSEIMSDGNIPKDAKEIIHAAIILEDLHQAEGILPIIDRINGNYNSSSHLTDKDKDVFRQIKEGTRTRLRSQLSRTIKKTRLIEELKQSLEIINSKDEDSVDDVFDIIERFLIRAENEIGRTMLYIKRDLGDNMSNWDPQQINYIRQDLIGYYEGLLKSIRDLFTTNSAVAKVNKIRSEDPAAIDLEHFVNELYHNLTDLLADYQNNVVMPYAEKVLMDFVNDSDIIDNKDRFIKNMKTWLYLDTAYGDLRAGEIVLGMASRSKSPIIRIVEKMISDVEFERNRQVLKKGTELIRLYNKIRPAGSLISFSNFLKMFIELDGEDGLSGMPTGYFVRDRNYGRFYKEKDEFEQKLREKYSSKGVTWKLNPYNDSIETIFPEEDHRAEHSVFNQYYDELDEWLDKHCERRYKLAYYKKKRRIMSPEAIKAQLLIQHQIDILCQKAMDEDGWVDTNKLDLSERSKLQELKKQKRELASPYLFRTNSDGIVTLEEKVGEAAEISKQIRDWNEFIAKKVTYKESKERFEKALSRYPEGSIERRRFIRDNYIEKINPLLYEAMEMWYGKPRDYGKEYDDLKLRYRSILNHLKLYEGFAPHNLEDIGTGINLDSSVWRELKRIEQRMSDIRAEFKANEESGGQKVEDEAPTYLTSLLIMSKKDNKPLFEYLRQVYISSPGLDGKNNEEFLKMFTYTDEKGRIRSLKAFTYNAPIGDEFKFDPQDEEEQPKKSLIRVYSSQFNELDESSEFVNENWDKTLGVSLQPKIRKPEQSRQYGQIDYTNDQYLLVMLNENYKKFYDLLITTMNEANSMIPARAIERLYLMPQITGRGLQVLGRSRTGLDLLNAVGYMFLDVFTTKFAERDGDVSTNWDLPRRPDGTVVNNIPIRFVKRLENPALISTDVIGSVMMYYDMAVNYRLKSENLPSLELMKEALNPENSTGSHKLSKQYEKLSNMLDFRYYGKEDSIGDDTFKAPSELNKRMTNVGKKFRRLASMSMLALNFTTIEVGYIDALLSSVADAVGGKYFTTTDLRHGYGLVARHFPNMITNLGNPQTDDWMIAAMQYNQLSKSNSELFDRTDQSKFRRLLNQTRMGGYTITDYIINTMILGATYNHYRLVELPDSSGKKFMSQSDTIREYTKLGYTEEQAINIWKGSKTTLEQAYTVKNGLFTVKDEFSKYVNKKLENQIAGRLRDRTAVYNGVIPATEKAKIQQNVWGSFLTLMRNFYVNTYWERALSGYDTATSEEILSSKLGMMSADSAGYVNFETGEFGNGLWYSFLKGIYILVANVKNLIQSKDLRQLTRDQRYAVSRILTELGMIAASAFIMLFSIAFARDNDYDKDKDPAWTINVFDPEGEDRNIIDFNGKNFDKKFTNWLRWKFALLSTRTFTERTTFYWPGTVTELISSPSTAKSYLDDLGYNLELFMDLFEINGHNRNDLVKSGGYKGMTRGTRDVLKITGFTGIDNVVRGWHTAGIKSTLNWYQLVSPNNFLIPTKETWKKQQAEKKKQQTQKFKLDDYSIE